LSGIRKNWLNQRKESVIIPVYKKAIKLTAVNYRGISLLSTSYRPRKYSTAFHSKCGIDEGLIKGEAQQTSDGRGAGTGWGPPPFF
jgi:hypothetical protein